ncbi:MAG: tetratricopeptide repeat protein [Candidatus Gracilibacteria bacterium]|nr:tetratricopeptide repeat protein [Candidatus Gracilibacteria bacterium]
MTKLFLKRNMYNKITKKDIKLFITIFACIFILFIVILNFFNIKTSFYNALGNYYFEKNNIETLKNYQKALNSTGNENLKNTVKYNIGNTFYKNNDFSGAIKTYEDIKTDDKELNFRINHNLGNAYYRAGEKIESDKNRFTIWNQSLKKYEKALEIKKDEETQKNYDFVKDKLKKLQEQIAKNSQKNPQTKPMPGGKNGDNNQNKSDEELKNQENSNTGSGKSEEGDKSKDNKNFGKTMTNSGSFNNIGKNTGSGKLSEEDKKMLEQYTKELNDLQKEYQKYLNRNGENAPGVSESGSINDFSGNGDENGGKDW